MTGSVRIPAFQSVDIRYFGGKVVLGVEPTKRRWTIQHNDFDIKDWRPSGETEWRPNPLFKTERNAA